MRHSILSISYKETGLFRKSAEAIHNRYNDLSWYGGQNPFDQRNDITKPSHRTRPLR
jgi:hypothetical protein